MKHGIVINQRSASCSIYESGKIIYDILSSAGNEYKLDYFETDSELTGFSWNPYDFYIINWHHLTLPIGQHLLNKMKGKKIAIVVEVSPTEYMPYTPNWFDAYAIIDPTKERTGKYFPLPRPIISIPTLDLLDSSKLVFGSFGLYSDPCKEEKRFYEIVEAANQSGMESIVRINLPEATFTASPIETIVAYGDKLKKMANSKVDVRITHNYMDRNKLIRWLSQHNMNCFPYYRERPGLSAVTDQAISAGRAIMTTECNTFRHLHRYINYYPKESYLSLMETTLQGVKQMQVDWGAKNFNYQFNSILVETGVI
jgi:glycosyltransferase involved in cell wall biosynthesis